MKKNSIRKNHSDFDDNYEFGKKGASKDKSSKKRLSIYDEYDEEDDLIQNQEKFKHRRH